MKIVIVEDERHIRKGLAAMLPRINEHYEVAGMAEDGREGLRMIQEIQPDLVILDIRMPQMDGLEMLRKLREEGNVCKAVVLTAYQDFSYAKQAIELGIENYLLKPIKLPELKKTLEIIEEALEREIGQGSLFTLERIFRSSILGELSADETTGQVVREKYGLDIEEQLVLFGVTLGDEYERWSGTVTRILEVCAEHSRDYRCCVLRSERYQMVLAVIYHIQDAKRLQRHFAEAVMPVICRDLSGDPVFTWAESENLKETSDAFAQILDERKWNLTFLETTLISQEQIETLKTQPLRISQEREMQIRQAMVNQDRSLFEREIRGFVNDCRNELHHPDDIREVCMRFCMLLIHVGRGGSLDEIIPASEVFRQISQAVSWQTILEILSLLYQKAVTVPDTKEGLSPMVRRAAQLIEEYYSQGLTLEETAARLCVSEEYLSSQFKKETGASFTETIRKCRIERMKELLVTSNLKLNQIAHMVGYSDPKYMSRVFKDEVGMLPADYRKSHL